MNLSPTQTLLSPVEIPAVGIPVHADVVPVTVISSTVLSDWKVIPVAATTDSISIITDA